MCVYFDLLFIENNNSIRFENKEDCFMCVYFNLLFLENNNCIRFENKGGCFIGLDVCLFQLVIYREQ